MFFWYEMKADGAWTPMLSSSKPKATKPGDGSRKRSTVVECDDAPVNELVQRWPNPEDMEQEEVPLHRGPMTPAAVDATPSTGDAVAPLTPPDFERCQAFPNVARHSPFSLGPMPKPVRCDAAPVWLAVETQPGDDGRCGSMTLCQPCAALMMESRRTRERVQLQPITPGGAS